MERSKRTYKPKFNPKNTDTVLTLRGNALRTDV